MWRVYLLEFIFTCTIAIAWGLLIDKDSKRDKL